MILQRIREAERDMMFEEYRDRVGELITGIVQQSDSRYTLVQLRERVEALLPKSEQVDGERYDHSQRIKAVIKEVSASTKGPSIIVSRRDPELIKKLFELEVPEIADGLVEITNVAREPGYRSKIAVISHADGVDPVGACVGPRGSRVRMVVSELRGEKIDIIPYNDEPARFVAKALSPARVREVLVDDDDRQATVDRPRRPALAGDRPRGPERPPGRPPDRLARRHQVRDRVRRRGGRGRLRGGGRRGPLRRDPLHRPPLPERRAARLALLRPRRPSGAPRADSRGGLDASDIAARRRRARREAWPEIARAPSRRRGRAAREGRPARRSRPPAEPDGARRGAPPSRWPSRAGAAEAAAGIEPRPSGRGRRAEPTAAPRARRGPGGEARHSPPGAAASAAASAPQAELVRWSRDDGASSPTRTPTRPAAAPTCTRRVRRLAGARRASQRTARP